MIQNDLKLPKEDKLHPRLQNNTEKVSTSNPNHKTYHELALNSLKKQTNEQKQPRNPLLLSTVWGCPECWPLSNMG